MTARWLVLINGDYRRFGQIQGRLEKTEKTLTIDAGYFNAGVIIDQSRCIAAAPIVRYMVGWDEERIVSYCGRKGWRVSVTKLGMNEETPMEKLTDRTG